MRIEYSDQSKPSSLCLPSLITDMASAFRKGYTLIGQRDR